MNFFKNKNVLVTGGAGFVGTNLIQRLLSLGANVTATLHTKKPQISDSKVRYIRADLRDANACSEVVQGIDYVFMCAANTSGASVIENAPLTHLTPNVQMNISMLDAAYKAEVKKFLFISSNTVYPLTDFPVKEEDVTNIFYEKYHIVAWMKRFTEIVCDMYATKINSPMKTCVVRPANIFGEYDDFEWETSHVIPALIRKVLERHNPLEVWGDGTDLKEFIYIDDFIDGVIAAMESPLSIGPINLATSLPVTVNDVLSIIIELEHATDLKIQYNKTKPSMIPKRLISSDLAEKLLHFKAKTSLKDGLQNTISWYIKNSQIAKNANQ